MEMKRKLSWFGRLQNAFNRLKSPNWVSILVIFALLFGAGLLIMGLSEGFANLSVEPIYILVLFQMCYVFFLVNLLDKQAISTLEEFQPQLESSEIEPSLLKDKFTYLSPKIINWITAVIGVLAVTLGIMIFAQPAGTSDQFIASEVSFPQSPFGFFQLCLFAVLWLFNFIFIYHTVHKIRALNYVFSEAVDINVFRQNGLYAFSKLGASTGIGLVLISPIWLILDPGVLSLWINIGFSIAAVLIFIFPLVGTHNLLEKQKSVLLSSSWQKKEAIINELYQQVEKKDYSSVKELDEALHAVDAAHKEIESISSWPWDNETIRRLFGAILLPILVWVIQFFLSELLSA